MRKRLVVAVFITFLSVSTALAGHFNYGTGFWCNCNATQSHAELRIDETDDDKELTRPDQDNELEPIVSVLLLWLRLVA